MRFGHASMREARAHLADLLDDAEQGNVTFVTRHGRAVAAIAPAPLLEQVGQALDALPPKMDNAADIILTAEDGSTIYMQVKVYSDRQGQAEQPEDARSAPTPSAATGDVLVVAGPPGTGKSATLLQIIERHLHAGRPIVLLDPSGEYMRSAADADISGDPLPVGDTLPPSSEARTR